MSQNNKTIISLVIVAAVLIGGYFIFTAKKDTGETPDTGAVQGESKKMAFSEFIKQGGSYKCTVQQAVSDMENSGVVYMSGGNMRGEFTSIAEGKTVQSTFILRDGFSYTWSDVMPTIGFKTKVATNASGQADAGMSGTYGWNAEQIGDYNCEAWTPDPSMFTVPTNIKFTELGDK